jgi:hypothetical protein
MAIAPFIRPIQVQGGTFYTFSSASDDLSLTFNNSGKKFTFSKYALLDLPNIQRPTYPSPNEENFMQLDAIPGAFANVSNAKTSNLLFAESLQNYALNLEAMLLSFPTYDPNSLQTTSERVFFKWLKETGAIRFQQANAQQANSSAGSVFVEESESLSYTPVVKYIADIDLVNSLKSIGDAYSEIYINVPSKDGATPVVLFKSVSDTNYYAAQNLINSPADPANTNYLLGRSYDQVNPAGLNTLAYFDSEYSNYGIGATVGLLQQDVPTSGLQQGDYQLFQYNNTNQIYQVGWWFLYPEASSYWTQPASTSGTFDSPGKSSYLIRGIKNGIGSTVSSLHFSRTNLDGISLDFNINDYYPISSNPALKGFSDFNSIPESVSFQFNTVLVYYDIMDTSTGNSATNLFGVLFLDNVQDSLTGSAYIPRLDKFKPNTVSGLNGNAYGFKINLKFDTNNQQAAIATSVNEYSPFSLHVFLDALNRMQSISNQMLDYQNQIIALQLEVNQLNDAITGGSSISQINAEIASINAQLETAGVMFENSATLTDLIAQNYQEITNIYANLTSVNMSYNLDVIKSGSGISIDKSIPNQLTFNNTVQGYNIPSSPFINVLTDFKSTATSWNKTIALNPYSNYIKIDNGLANAFNKNINIYIDDTYVRWVTGQTYRIVVDANYPMDMYTQGSFNLSIFTDAIDRAKNGIPYGVEAGIMYSSDFYTAKGAPRIEIICVDAATYTFTFDLI